MKVHINNVYIIPEFFSKIFFKIYTEYLHNYYILELFFLKQYEDEIEKFLV